MSQNEIPGDLLACLFPGMQVCLEKIVGEINQVRRSLGMTGIWKVILEKEPVPAIKTTKKRKTNGAGKGATEEQMVQYARNRGGGQFDTAMFKAAHPGLHVRGVGRLVRGGIFVKTGAKGVYSLEKKATA